MKREHAASSPAELAERVEKTTGVDAEKVKQTADELFKIIAEEINVRESFKLQGFGTFKKVLVPAPKSSAEETEDGQPRPPHYKVKFLPASALAERINKPYEHLKPLVLAAGQVPDKTNTPGDEPETVPAAAEAPSESLTDAGSPSGPHDARDAAAAPVPLQSEPSAERALPTVNQTIEHAVIEQQIIRQQIIRQQIIQQIQPPAEQRASVGTPSPPHPDNGGDDELPQSYVYRCWFLAGAAVVLTALVLGFLSLTLMQRNRTAAPAPAAAAVRTVRPKTGAERVPHTGAVSPLPSVTVQAAPSQAPARSVRLKIAADDNLYAQLAGGQYGMRSLWPYIFSANMLRYPDPDRPGAAGKLVVPQKPDMRIDRKDIELSVIDVYDAYRTLITKQPKGRTAAQRREHAVTSLVCGEALYSGFIRRYAVRFDPADVQAAEEQIQKASAR